MKNKKNIPQFKSEDEERAFWAKQDSAHYIDWENAERLVLADLKPSTRSISIRLSVAMLNEIRLLANKKDIPYQSLIKMFLAERVQKEIKIA